jgi:hypothetical protein
MPDETPRDRVLELLGELTARQDEVGTFARTLARDLDLATENVDVIRQTIRAVNLYRRLTPRPAALERPALVRRTPSGVQVEFDTTGELVALRTGRATILRVEVSS